LSPLALAAASNYASLEPGYYRFFVRVADSSSDQALRSDMPASVEFTILPPVWAQLWFRAAAAVFIGVNLS
jgi:hypothetical protein